MSSPCIARRRCRRSASPAEAEKVFREAVAADPANLEAQVGVAQTLAEQGRGTEAREMVARLAKDHPDSALAALAYGEMLAFGNDLAGARRELQRAATLAPKQLDVPRQVALLTTLIEASIAARDLEAARADSDILGRLIPGSPLAGLMKARVAMADNDYVAAATELRRIVARAPDLLQAHLLLGMTLAAQGNLQQASLELGQVLDRAPGNIEARQLYAQVRMRLEDPDGALRALVPALEASDGDPYLTLLTDTARSQAGASGSVQLLEQALKRTPDNRSLQTQLASAYLQSGAPDKALAVLQKDPAQRGRAPWRLAADGHHAGGGRSRRAPPGREDAGGESRRCGNRAAGRRVPCPQRRFYPGALRCSKRPSSAARRRRPCCSRWRRSNGAHSVRRRRAPRSSACSRSIPGTSPARWRWRRWTWRAATTPRRAHGWKRSASGIRAPPRRA